MSCDMDPCAQLAKISICYLNGRAAASLRGEPLRDQRHPEQQVSNRRILGRQSGDTEGGEQREQ